MNQIAKKQILFVDDEPMVLKGLQRTLRKMRTEWEMAFSSSGKEALEILGQRPMDVIVSDLKMPEMNGMQLLTEVKTRHPRVVRIILSGHLEHEMTLQSVQFAHQSLSKPCDAKILKNPGLSCLPCAIFWLMRRLKKSYRKLSPCPAYPPYTAKL